MDDMLISFLMLYFMRVNWMLSNVLNTTWMHVTRTNALCCHLSYSENRFLFHSHSLIFPKPAEKLSAEHTFPDVVCSPDEI